MSGTPTAIVVLPAALGGWGASLASPSYAAAPQRALSPHPLVASATLRERRRGPFLFYGKAHNRTL